MATRFRTFKYPELQVMLPADRKVVFHETYAEVPDEDLEAFERFLATPFGTEVGIARIDEGEVPTEDPDTLIGLGYTEAERQEALRQLRLDEPAPPPPADQRTEGVVTAQAQPDATPAAAAAQANDVTGDGKTDHIDIAAVQEYGTYEDALAAGHTDAEARAAGFAPVDDVPAASPAPAAESTQAPDAGDEAESGADVGTDAAPEGGSDEAQGTQDPDADGNDAPEDGLEDFTKNELKQLAEAKGLQTTGNKDDLIARIRGA